MTTTAATWFYDDPERIPYYLEERVNQNFWQARVYDIWLDATSAEPPFRMSGTWRDQTVEIEWQPKKYLTLRLTGEAEADDLVQGISRMLALEPSCSYEDTNDHFCVEWHASGAMERWQEIQGKAAYRNPQRYAR